MRFQSRLTTSGFSRTLARTLVLTFLVVPLAAQKRAPRPSLLKPDERAALDRISADSLKGHLSFIASDLLEGRATP